MHEMFADWYQLVDPGAGAEIIKLRWASAEAVAGDLSHENALELVRIAQGRSYRSSTNEFEITLRKAMKEEDAAFPMKGKEIDVRVTACACLASALGQESSAVTDVLAYAATLCPDSPESDTVAIARALGSNYLANQSIAERERHDLDEDAIPQMNVADVLTPISTPATDPAGWIVQANEVLTKIAAKCKEINAALINRASLGRENELAQDEELNILWWLLTEYSDNAQQPFGQMSLPLAVRILPHELADLTAFVPGPSKARMFLARVLDRNAAPNETQISLVESVTALSADWLGSKRDSCDHRLEDFCPTLLSLRLIGKDSTWADSVQSMSNFDARLKRDPVELAARIYDELLLTRSIRSQDRR